MSVKQRGFGSMDAAARRRIASMGGYAAHKKGTAHEWDREAARLAGQKGGRMRRHKAAAFEDLRTAIDHELDRFTDEGNPHS